jgi:methoxymalonate biosynthesis acyl carrier protein
MDVRARIRSFFDEEIAEEVRDDDDIFELGVVDSLFALQLVLFVEKEFAITAQREDLDINNFRSIAALTNFVLKKLGRAADLELGHEHPTE